LLVAADAILAALQSRLLGTPAGVRAGAAGAAGAFWEAGLQAAEAWAAWSCYHHLARGARCLGDPRSAVAFLLAVPVLVTGLFAPLHALGAWLLGAPPAALLHAAGACWMSRALGIVAVTPPLLALLTPVLVRRGLARPGADADTAEDRGASAERLVRGDWVEVGGLALAAGGFAALVVLVCRGPYLSGWQVWAVPMLLIVWAALRQGLPGGTVVAAAATVLPVTLAGWVFPAGAGAIGFQGNLLTECCLALLVSASTGWLRASEARYRRVVGHIPVVLYSVRVGAARPRLPDDGPADLDAEITFVSPACRQLLGCPPERLLGPYAGWLRGVHPDDRELVLAAVAQLHRQNQPVTCEYRLSGAGPAGDGQASGGSISPSRFARPAPPAERWVRDTLAPHVGRDGRLDGWEGVLTDITEQRALSADLRRTTGMFHALVSHLPAGVFFVHGDTGRPILVNARARQLLGQHEDSGAELQHLARVYRLFRPDGTPYPLEDLPVYLALRKGLTTMRDNIVVHRPTAGRLPLVTWAAPIDLGGGGRPDAAVWVFEDLSGLRRAEAALAESEDRLRAVIATMAEGLLVQNQDGAVVECNPAATAILGRPAEELIGRPFPDPDHPCLCEDGTAMPPGEYPAPRSLGTGLPVRDVVLGIPRAVKPDSPSPAGGGGPTAPVKWILVNTLPLPAGRLPGGARLVTTFTDITAYRQALEDLQRAQRVELVGRLASGVAHDFNNLLTVILSLADLARGQLPEGHPLQQELTGIAEAGEQAAGLAAQLLAFSKQRRPAPRGVDFNRVVGRTLELLRRTLPATIEVGAELDGDALAVRADETQMQQVVMNLCLNARDAMPAGGHLLVQTAAEEGWARLTVQDTGEGMSEAVRARIFDPFFSTKQHGSGLGLAVVQQIVSGFGGRVEVHSRPGAGARFDVRLPRWPAEPEPPVTASCPRSTASP
jgi:PAS domain-containing protein